MAIDKYEAAALYDNRYAKTDFIRNELTSLRVKMKLTEDLIADESLGLSEESIKGLEQMKQSYLDVRNRILDDPDLCEQPHGSMYDVPEGLVPQGFSYEDEKFEKAANDMFAEIARTAKDEEVREIASDIESLENSVADAKIAYETDDLEVARASAETLAAIDAAERVMNYDASDIHYDKMIESPSKEQIEKAKEILDDITGTDAHKSVAMEMREAALKEVGKHPFRYAIYSSKENFKSIMKDVSDGRALVKATEGTFLDSVKSTAKSAAYAMKNGATQATSMALQAGRNTCVTAAQNLNQAYEKGSEMLLKAKDALKKTAVNVMQKADRVMEAITIGGYSKMLEAASRKAFVSMDAENQTLGDKIAQNLVKVHSHTHGYTLDEACDYISKIKTDLWADGKSPLDGVVDFVKESKFEVAKETNAMKKSFESSKEVTKDNLSKTKETVVGKAQDARDYVTAKAHEFKDFASERIQDVKRSAKETVQDAKDNMASIKASVIEKVARAKDKIVDNVEIAKDKAAVAAKTATLAVKKESLGLQAQACLNAIRFYEKVQKVNDYRIDKAIEKSDVKNDKLFEAMANRDMIELDRPEEYKMASFEIPSDLKAAIESLNTIENKGTAELFAKSILEKKVDKAEKDFDKEELSKFALSKEDVHQWNTEMSYANKEVSALEADCDKAMDKIASLSDRGVAISNKLDALYNRMDEKFVDFARANKELETFKKETADARSTESKEDVLEVEEPEMV